MTNKNHLFASLGLSSLTVISGFFLFSANSYADDSVVDNINITVPVSCSLEGTGMTSHNANMMNGTYQNNIGTTTMKAYCNDNEGFAIYANGYTGDTLGNNKLIGRSTNEEMITGTATSTPNPDISNWSMKLSTPTSPTPTYPLTIDSDTNGSFTSYHIVPSTYTKVAHRDSGTDIGTSAEGATLTSTYAAYISKTQPADTYQGQVIYTLVHPASEGPKQPIDCDPGKICYQPNSSSVIGEMGKQTIPTSATSATLWASNFKRTGYGFAGWNNKYDYSGTFYGPNQNITFARGKYTGSNGGLSLYAVWIKSAGTLQNWDGCSSLAQGVTTALTDERDGNTYAVAKLVDGKCWMIENLRLDDSAELSSSNTHNPSLPLTNIYDSSTISNYLSPNSSLAYNATNAPEGWCDTDSSACDDQSRLRTDNTVLFTNNTSLNYDPTSNVYSYGNYYNWYSASAGHGKYGLEYGSNYTVIGDICPFGWHLPTGGSATAEYGALDVAMGGTGTSQTSSVASNRWRSYPNNFVYSGKVDGSLNRERNTYGYYWSSTINYNGNVRNLYFYGVQVSPISYSNGNYHGWSVRCISDK